MGRWWRGKPAETISIEARMAAAFSRTAGPPAPFGSGGWQPSSAAPLGSRTGERIDPADLDGLVCADHGRYGFDLTLRVAEGAAELVDLDDVGVLDTHLLAQPEITDVDRLDRLAWSVCVAPGITAAQARLAGLRALHAAAMGLAAAATLTAVTAAHLAQAG